MIFMTKKLKKKKQIQITVVKIYYLNYIEVSKITRIPKSDKLKKQTYFPPP